MCCRNLRCKLLSSCRSKPVSVPAAMVMDITNKQTVFCQILIRQCGLAISMVDGQEPEQAQTYALMQVAARPSCSFATLLLVMLQATPPTVVHPPDI